jgi:hypothetical protein
MFTILDMKIIKGYYYLNEHFEIALIISGFNSYLFEFSFNRYGNLKACAYVGSGNT